MASPQAEAVKEQLVIFASSLGPDTELDAMRDSYATFAGLSTTPEGVTWTAVDAGGVPAIWADAEGGATDRVVEYVHGGGYVIGNADYYRNLTGHLAKAIGCRVLNVDYRLAPEHPHPAPVEDSTAPTVGCSTRASSPATSPSPATPPAAASPWPPWSASATPACPSPPPPCRSRLGSTWRPPARR